MGPLWFAMRLRWAALHEEIAQGDSCRAVSLLSSPSPNPPLNDPTDLPPSVLHRDGQLLRGRRGLPSSLGPEPLPRRKESCLPGGKVRGEHWALEPPSGLAPAGKW